MGETEQSISEGAIELHPEIVKQRQDTYSSLTDLQGVDVFSDEFKNSVETVVKQRKEAEKQLGESVFVEETEYVTDLDDWLISQMFYEQEEMLLSQNYEKGETRLSVMDISMVLIAVFTVIVLYLFIFSDKRTRRKNI